MTNMIELHISITRPLKELASTIGDHMAKRKGNAHDGEMVLSRLKVLRVRQPWDVRVDDMEDILDHVRFVETDRALRQITEMLPRLAQFALGGDCFDIRREGEDKFGQPLVDFIPVPPKYPDLDG